MTSTDLKALRGALGLTQQQIAAEIGCGTSTYARWEQQPADKQIPMLAVYARALAKLQRKAKQGHIS